MIITPQSESAYVANSCMQLSSPCDNNSCNAFEYFENKLETASSGTNSMRDNIIPATAGGDMPDGIRRPARIHDIVLDLRLGSVL